MLLCWYRCAEEPGKGDRDPSQPVPSKNLLGIPPSCGWVSSLGLHRQAQEVSHRGREIDGLEVWAATVTISLQDGCGFADRESAAWTCQRCRSEVSSGEPGPPRPRHSQLRPTRERHLLSISWPWPREGAGGRDLLPGPNSHHTEWTLRQRRQGEVPGTQVKEKRTRDRVLLLLGHSNEILH